MKICDRCGERAVDEVILKSEDTHVDVCGGCRQHVLEALRPCDEPKAWAPHRGGYSSSPADAEKLANQYAGWEPDPNRPGYFIPPPELPPGIDPPKRRGRKPKNLGQPK